MTDPAPLAPKPDPTAIYRARDGNFAVELLVAAITRLDLSVDAIARKTVFARGLADRVEVVAGDMFKSMPEGADVHLFSNVLHDWREAQCRDLLARSHDALAPDGLVVIHDAFLNRDKTGPLHVAEYSVLLAHFTEGRCWSVGEMEAMLADSGFDVPRFVEVGAQRSALVARRA